jgi:cytoskeletal protein RodZ
MYEDTGQPVLRRVLWIILWFIIVATIAWALIWLVFFRHHSAPNTSGSITHAPQHSQSSKTQSPSTGSSSTSTKSGSSATTPPTSSTPTAGSSTQTPSTLANTGAGDVFIPFIAASLAGSVVYYVRLHKKLTQ